jgi:hypothetical protein
MRTLKSLVPALAIASAVLLAACGGGGSSSGSSPATTAATTPSSDAGDASNGSGQGGGRSNLNDPAVQQCLADKGVTMPSFPRRDQAEAPPDSAANPEGGGQRGGFGGLDDATRQALQDCGVTFGRGGQGGGGGGGGFGGAVNDPAVQQCLADKGITLPQRSAEQPPAEGTRPTIDDATRQAIQDCRAQAATTTTIAA